MSRDSDRTPGWDKVAEQTAAANGFASSDTLVDIRQVTASVGAHTLLTDLDFNVRRGELVFVLGPNGAGKTSLLRLLLGKLHVDSGAVSLSGKSPAKLPGKERAGLVGYLPQRSTLSEPMRVLDLVVAARYRFSESHPASVKAAEAALAETGAILFRDRVWSTLSGGEQQRVALATLLAQDSTLLLLDEPANHLDPAQQIEVYRQIGRLNKSGRTVVCITHDMNLIGRAAVSAERTPSLFGIRGGRRSFSCPFDSADVPRHLSELFGLPVARIPEISPATFVFGESL